MSVTAFRLAIVGIVATGLVVLALVLTKDDSCSDWQERYRALQRELSGGGVFDFVNRGPLAQLRREKPEGCAIPD